MTPAGLQNRPFPGSPTKLQTAKAGGTKPIAIRAACHQVAAGPFAHEPAENGQQSNGTAPQSIIEPSSILSPEAPDSMDAEVLGSWASRKVSFCPAHHTSCPAAHIRRKPWVSVLRHAQRMRRTCLESLSF